MSDHADDKKDDKGHKYKDLKDYKMAKNAKGEPIVIENDPHAAEHSHGFAHEVGKILSSKYFWIFLGILFVFGSTHQNTMHNIGNYITMNLVQFRNWLLCNIAYIVVPCIFALFLVAKFWENTKKAFKGGGGSHGKAH